MHTYIDCNNLLNTEIDDACLTELGKAFHRVMTLGTNDENMYCVRANGLLKLVCMHNKCYTVEIDRNHL